MATIKIELSRMQINALKSRTGKSDLAEAVKAWIDVARRPTAAQLRRAASQSEKEFREGKGESFTSARAAMEWLER